MWLFDDSTKEIYLPVLDDELRVVFDERINLRKALDGTKLC